ncbi:MAG: hypothetical protein VX278_07860, partial [Myxococcota bacterium]|nr:hypothetical protein [Myxococcota bacterium]
KQVKDYKIVFKKDKPKKSDQASFSSQSTSFSSQSTSSAGITLTCKEILELNSYNTPSRVIIKMIQDNGRNNAAEVAACLQRNGAPADIIAAVKKRAEAGQGSSSYDRESSFSSGRENVFDGEHPDKLKVARNNLKSNKPANASYLLYEMLKNNEYPEYKTDTHYYLGLSLEKLKLYHSAQYYYTKVVKAGPRTQYFNLAIPKLIRVAKMTGDNSTLTRVAKILPPQNFPRKAKNNLYYLLGAGQFSEKEYREAQQNFSKVTSRSALSLRARFFEGVIALKSDPVKAVRAFREVHEERVEPSSKQEGIFISNIQELALLNQASVYYTAGKFSDARSLYSAVNRKSRYWPDSLFRGAWASFMLGETKQTLKNIKKLESSYKKTKYFLPEADILKTLTYMRTCQYSKAEQTRDAFIQQYRPTLDEMKTILSQYQSKEAQRDADQLWTKYLAPDSDSSLPVSLLQRVRFNKALNDTLLGIEQIQAEKKNIQKQKMRWREVLASDLLKELERTEVKQKKLAGIYFLKEIHTQQTTLVNLFNQAKFIKIDLAERLKSNRQSTSGCQ